MMEDIDKIIESIKVKHISSRCLDILKPVSINNRYDLANRLILVTHGELYFGSDKQVVRAKDILFLPAGKTISLQYGQGTPEKFSSEELLEKKDQYFSDTSRGSERPSNVVCSVEFVDFSSKVFDSVNLFSSLDIPIFAIQRNESIGSLISKIQIESVSTEPGQSRVLNALTDILVVELLRYIVSNNLFLEQFATNATYFKDPRLIDIFSFIKENLNGNLSNKMLAKVANVSEDYVGQYFKMLTGINPQDYIEYQRMERAVTLLRTSKKSIRKIGVEVGYKDTAYFCRRFKMMFGIPAGKMRKRESTVSI